MTIIFSRHFSYIIFWIYVNFFNVFLDDVFGWGHLNIQWNIVVFRNIVYYWYFDTNIVENRNLKCSIVASLILAHVSYWSVILYWSCSVYWFRILEINLQVFSGQLWFYGVLFIDGRSWYIFFLNSSVFRKLSWENFRSVFIIFFLTVSDLESCSFSVNDRLKNALLINSCSWYWNLSLSDFGLGLNSLEDGLEFLFFDI